MSPAQAANLKQAAPYDVLVDGQSLGEPLMRRVEEIRVVDHLRLPDVCTVTISYPDPKEIDSQPFAIGNELEVKLGAIEDRPPTSLFKGDVVTLEPEFGAGGCRLTVRGFDKAHVLLRSRHAGSFQKQTSSDIVAKIVAKAGLSAKVDPSGDPHDFIQQDNETDWDFIWRLAERIGFEAVAAGSVLHFRKPSADTTAELVWPETLRSFNPRVTGVQQPSEVTLAAHDPRTKEAIRASVTQPQQLTKIGVSRDEVTSTFGESTVHIATEPVKTRNEGTALAQALLDKLANGYVTAEGAALGNPKIKAGTKITVSGVGSRFGGTYRIATASHVLRAGTFMTVFSSSPMNTVLGAVGAVNSGHGSDAPLFATQLVLGIVTNNNDPEGLGRVRVSYPALGPDVEGAWARVATPSAGKQRGLLMLPVVGEEVLVGFEGDNTTRPYVLGSLFNGKDTPGDVLLREKKGSFALRSDEEVYAESQKDFTQKSGGKLTVEIAGDVKEAFKQGWTNETGRKVSLTAGQSFEVQGQSVTLKGSTQVTIEGGSTLTLKCGGSEITLSSSGVKISGPVVNGEGMPQGIFLKG